MNIASEADDITQGYSYELVTPDDRFDCAVCLLVIRDPVQTPCGHRFCSYCINQWISEDQDAKCPIDNETITKQSLFPDNYAKRQILGLEVKCPNNDHGCVVITELRHMQDHEVQCDMVLVACTLCSNCVLKKELQHHVDDVCENREVPCSMCQERLPAKSTPAHKLVCPLAIVQCDDCSAISTRIDMTDHRAVSCRMAPALCLFQPFGCHEKVMRHALWQHNQQYGTQHAQMLAAAVLNISRLLRCKPDAYKQSVIPALGGETPSELSHLNIGQFYHELIASRVEVSSDANITSSGNPDEIGPNHESLRGACVQGATMDFQSDGTTKRGDARSFTPRGLTDVDTTNRQLTETCSQLQTRVTELEVTVARLSDLDGRLCDGTIYWTISNFRQCRLEAISGKVAAIYSPAFQSGLYGYRLNVRTNLDGVDKTRGAYASLFVHFVKGANDHFLRWPFVGKIVLSIVDQNPVFDERHNLTETLASKPDLACFQRPRSHRNQKGFGYIDFVSLSALETGSYVVDDTLVVKATVIPADIGN